MKFVALLSIFALSGCTILYYPSGKKLASVGSNVEGLSIITPAISVSASRIDNSSIHRAIGSGVSAGAIGVGTAIASSGIVGALTK